MRQHSNLASVLVATRSGLAVDAQVTAPGAIWLDRQLLAAESALASSGFGAELREATDRRIDHLIEQNLARHSVSAVDLATVVEDLVGRAAAGAGGLIIVRFDRPSSIFASNRNLRNRIGHVGLQAQRRPGGSSRSL